LQGIGAVKVKLYRPIEGKIKTVTVKRKAGKWYKAWLLECWPGLSMTLDVAEMRMRSAESEDIEPKLASL